MANRPRIRASTPRSSKSGGTKPPAPQSSAALKAVIVGGGIAGMTTALRLAERGFAVTILEKGPFVGGALSGVWYDDTFYEVYPHLFCHWYNNFWSLVSDIGLTREQIFSRNEASGFLQPSDFPHYHYLKNTGDRRTALDNLRSGVLSIPEMFLADYTILDLLVQTDSEADFLTNQTINDFVVNRPYATPAVTQFFNSTITNIWAIDGYLSSAKAYQHFAKYQFREPTPQSWVISGTSYYNLLVPLLTKLDQYGCSVQTNTTVNGITVDSGRVKSISYEGNEGKGQLIDIDNLILAVPPSSLSTLIFTSADSGDQGKTIVGTLPQLANVRRLASDPLPLLYVTFRSTLPDIPTSYVSLLNSKYSLSFVKVGSLSQTNRVTVLAIAASDFNALPINLVPKVSFDGRLSTTWMDSDPTLKAAAFLILNEFRRYVPFNLGRAFSDPGSDIDWDKTFFAPNLAQPLFINEVGSEKWSTQTNYPEIDNLYFTGDSCTNPITIATVESAVYSGLQAARALAIKYHLPDVPIIQPKYYSPLLLWPWKLMLMPYAAVAKCLVDFSMINNGSINRETKRVLDAHHPIEVAGAMWGKWWNMLTAVCNEFIR
jgi:hypothetical protein